ncbi:flavodoxin [Vallitalea longa]|uniref:Flavodoxin n=1 Tax=Vallitalea longa TaxID=2936439 RepID=A0A9W6DEF0_9FIRM|nr:flavodoxin [Vallitalea longa]GKX28383.1 flavodoxin [Vallitalea longa]
MDKVLIVYWSGTGNTEAMANAIAKGIESEGKEVDIVPVDSANEDMIKEVTYVALGCPSMGVESLEEDEMEPFVESLKNIDWSDKKLALFGSYDWGDGEWMRNWKDRMESYGAKLVADGLIVNLEPQGEELDNCTELGKTLVNA